MLIQRSRMLSLAAAIVISGCAARAPAPPPAPRAATAAPAKPLDAQEAQAAAADRIEVTFASGSAALSSEAARQLDTAARLFRDVGPARMFAIGHSDAQGNEFGNVLLSAQRARAVKDGLVARGIPRERLYIQALGESEPINGAPAAANRRVVVKWQML